MPASEGVFVDLLSFIDAEWYREEYNILPNFDPKEHYLTEGWWRLFDPCEAVSTTKALLHCESLEPLNHFWDGWQHEDPRLAGLGSTAFTVRRTYEDPLTPGDEEILTLAREILLSRYFNPAEYLEANQDVKKTKINPFFHYSTHGISEGRPISRALSDVPKYINESSEHTRAELIELLSRDRESRRPIGGFPSLCSTLPDRSALMGERAQRELQAKLVLLQNDHFFDERWVRFKYKNLLAQKKMTPEELLLSDGNELLLDPSPQFSTSYYLAQYPDVRAADEYALLHFIKHGRDEGRCPRFGHGEVLDRSGVSDVVHRRVFDLSKPISPFDGNVRLRREFTVERLFSSDEIPEVDKDFTVMEMSRPVTVIGASNIIIDDQYRILSDDLKRSLEDKRYDLKGSTAQRASDESVYLEFRRQSHFGLDKGLNCLNVYDRNYFHFLIEVLPKFLLAEKLDIPNSIPALITAGLNKNFLDLIALFNPSSRPVIEIQPDTAVQVNTLFAIQDCARILDTYNEPMSTNEVKISPTVFDLLDTKLLPYERLNNSKFEKKLYLRRAGEIRNPSNEREVENVLNQRGFQAIDPRAMTIEEQIAAFSNATHIIAPTGASLTNLVWCQQGTEIIVLKSDHPNINLIFWQEIAAARELNYREVIGQRCYDVVGIHAVHDNYYVDLDSLDDALVAS